MTETPARPVARSWPAHLRPGALRWARSSSHYDETVHFYRVLVGLPVVGSFTASFGEDGTIFGLPGTGLQLEIVRAKGAGQPADPLDQLVLYLQDADAVSTATRVMRAHGLGPDPSPPAYWLANGAVRYVDPDGRGVVYAPWVYGVEPDPIDRHPSGSNETRIELFAGDREGLRALFELAEDSPTELDSYIDIGRVLVAIGDGHVLGHLQLVDTLHLGDVELKNMAVREDHQGRGLGRQLVHAAIDVVASEGSSRMVVATASADIGNLRFYQRLGFRMRSIERDAFTSANGYPPDSSIDGIGLRDRVWLDYEVRS
jgi:GNAT superfamily N-acetyltransferase